MSSALVMTDELIRYEEKGLKFLAAFANGDTPQGRSAKEKLDLIKSMKQTHPLAYIALLKKNFENDNRSTKVVDADVEEVEHAPAM